MKAPGKAYGISGQTETSSDGQQWAKIPERAAYMKLGETALNVLIILAAKAGRDRVAWISQVTIGQRLGKDRTTIGKAIRRLEKAQLVQPAGTVVVDYKLGTWVRKYKVAPYLPEVRSGFTSGSRERDPMSVSGGTDGNLGGPDVNSGFPHSVPQNSVPHTPERLDEEEEQKSYRGSVLAGTVRKVGRIRRIDLDEKEES
jgi:hypothetical protein